MNRDHLVRVVLQKVAGDCVSIYGQGPMTLLFGLCGPESLRFQADGRELATYVYVPIHKLRPPAWVKR